MISKEMANHLDRVILEAVMEANPKLIESIKDLLSAGQTPKDILHRSQHLDKKWRRRIYKIALLLNDTEDE